MKHFIEMLITLEDLQSNIFENYAKEAKINADYEMVKSAMQDLSNIILAIHRRNAYEIRQYFIEGFAHFALSSNQLINFRANRNNIVIIIMDNANKPLLSLISNEVNCN